MHCIGTLRRFYKYNPPFYGFYHQEDHKIISMHQSDRDCSVSDPVLRNTTDPNDFMPNCTTAQMIEALDGHLSLIHSTFANDEDVMETGDSVQEWKDSLRAQV